MKEFRVNQVLRFGLFFYFLIPYFIFLTFYHLSYNLNFDELQWALKNSFIQSALTAVISVFFSIPLSQGLLFLPDNVQFFLKRLLVIPQILPALFSILIAFSLLNPFPMGTPGIVFLFVLINLGFATLLTYMATQARLGNLAIISEIYSLGRYRFFSKVYLPILKSDLIINFFMIFIFCLSSFSIPLIVGGGKGANLELLIYEKIFVDQNWPAAFTLCVLQVSFVFMLSFFILRYKKNEAVAFTAGKYLQSLTGALLVLIYIIIYLGGYTSGLIKSFSNLNFILQYISEIITVTIFTTKALLVYLLINTVLLYLWIYDYLNNYRFNLGINLISVSTVLIGFSFYLAFPLSRDYDMIKINFAMSILFFPALFKIFLQKPIEELQSQLVISQVCGLSKPVIIFEIIIKQISKQLYLWLSFLIIWFISEFALLKALGVQTQTLGLMTESFLSSYRLQLSYLMSFYILIYWLLALLVIYLFLKVANVVYKKFVY